MHIFTTITILLVYVALVMMAFRKNNPAWKIGCVAVVLAILIGREMAIDIFAQSQLRNLNLTQTGIYFDGFKVGLSYELILAQRTGIFVFSLYLIILALFVKGFRRPKSQPKTEPQDNRG